MARQVINTGTTANDGTGDTLRNAGSKINENFVEVYAALGGGDSGTSLTTAVKLVDSGLEYVGVSNNSVLTHTEGASKLVFTLPDSEGAVVINSATQTLTNKTLDSATINNPVLDNVSINDTNASHQYLIKPANLTTKDINVNLPLLADSDTITFNAQTQTLTNKTLTSPRIGTAILDAGGDEIIKFTEAGTPANEITINNANASASPGITATGTDTNVDLNVTPKGTGAVVLGKVAYASKQLTLGAAGDSDMTQDTFIIANPSGTTTIHMDDGTVNGELRIILNRGTATLKIREDSASTNFDFGSYVSLAPNAMAQFIWETVENNWHILGTDSSGPNITIV
jgi:hypothetical protein